MHSIVNKISCKVNCSHATILRFRDTNVQGGLKGFICMNLPGKQKQSSYHGWIAGLLVDEDRDGGIRLGEDEERETIGGLFLSEVQSQCNGNSQESMRLTLVQTLSKGYMKPKQTISYNQVRLPVEGSVYQLILKNLQLKILAEGCALVKVSQKLGRVTNQRPVELEIHSPKGSPLLTLPRVTGNRGWIAQIPRIELNTISNNNNNNTKVNKMLPNVILLYSQTPGA